MGSGMPLTELRAKKIAPDQKPLADGTAKGLWLVPNSNKGRGKWILRFISPMTGKRRDMGLGSYPEVGISEAREAGTAARKTIARRRDPIEERQAEKAANAELVGEVELTGGTNLTERVSAVRGTPRNPMSRAEVVYRARDLTAPVLGREAADRLIETVLAIEAVADVGQLRQLLQRG